RASEYAIYNIRYHDFSKNYSNNVHLKSVFLSEHVYIKYVNTNSNTDTREPYSANNENKISSLDLTSQVERSTNRIKYQNIRVLKTYN
ncbi:hypothetical protein, partial [Campylobacter hyointestinalis]|uniref:hypothetical protein n=1 Tax=Campylobacter hyointestinalis TaxID=198 RepID=UPI000D4CBAF7